MNLTLGIATPQAVIDAAANAAAQPAATSLSSVSDTLPDLDQLSLRRGKAKVLSLVNVQSTNIPPKEAVTYAKQTQTIESGPELSTRGRGGGGLDYYTLTCEYFYCVVHDIYASFFRQQRKYVIQMHQPDNAQKLSCFLSGKPPYQC